VRVTTHRDRLTGTWVADDGGQLALALDGRQVTGTVTAGRPDNIARIAHGSFDGQTGALRLEGLARHPNESTEVPFVVEGRLEGRRLHVRYQIGRDRGLGVLYKTGPWLTLRLRARAATDLVRRALQSVLIPVVRWRRRRLRPSKEDNRRALAARGESIDLLTFRDARPDELTALATLHVKTWAATYPEVRRPPTLAIREAQWRDAFANADGRWFCIVIENTRGELVGFAKGILGQDEVGDLNKIYLLTEYQRLGLGRRLVGHAARRFLDAGMSSMTLLADAANPSCAFYEALGAEAQRDEQGRRSRGAYIWKDLTRLG
jgi:GNAT superfamily N-acetyltransferase